MDNSILLQKLIQIPSLSGHEEKLAGFLVDYLKSYSISAKIQHGNVIVFIKGKNRNKTLILNAHMDTVSMGNRAEWRYPPTGKSAGRIMNGKIYGLGASDDKAAIASMMLLAKSMTKPSCDLWFVFVCNEETDGSGTEHFLQWFKKSKYFLSYKHIAAIIGEPTGLNNIEIGHRGNAFIRLTSYGITGHGAKKYSRNELAIEKMLKAISKLQKDFLTWKKKYKHNILGEPNLNITGLHTTGEYVNKLPDKCWGTLDIRTTPTLHTKLDHLLKKAIGDLVEISRMKGNALPGLTESDRPIVKVCKKILPNIHFSISLGSTDLSQFLQAGIDTVILGPGDKNVIHKENEYVYLDQIDKGIYMYDKLIQEYAKEN